MGMKITTSITKTIINPSVVEVMLDTMALEELVARVELVAVFA